MSNPMTKIDVGEIRVELPPCKHCGAVDFIELTAKAKAQLLALLVSRAEDVYANRRFDTNEGFEGERIEHFAAVPLSIIKELFGDHNG